MFVDSHGHQYQLETPVEVERGSYGERFERAVAYRARRLFPSRTRAKQHPSESTTNQSGHMPLPGDMLVTYIPLTTSLQESTTAPEAGSLQLVLKNIHLRRQVHHPYLRSLADAFYTDQIFSAPARASDGVESIVVEEGADASLAGTSPSRNHLVGQTCTLKDSEEKHWRAPAGASAMKKFPSTTALVVVEEYVAGCSLADYADAIAQKQLDRDGLIRQHDAVAIACQVTQLLLHLHLVGQVLCRFIPPECVHLSRREGCVKLRLPLCAVAMSDIMAGLAGCSSAAMLTYPSTSPADGLASAISDGGTGFICAPEIHETSRWDDVASAPTGGASRCADVWALGLLMLQLCSLTHSSLSLVHSATERLAVICGHLHEPKVLLPCDVEESIAEVIHSCLERSPARRPTLRALLNTTAFVKYGSNTSRDPNPLLIGLADAMTTKRKVQHRSAIHQQTAQHLRKMSRDTSSVLVDGTLMSLSLHDLQWTTPDDFRDAFLPTIEASSLTTPPSTPPGNTAPEDSSAVVEAPIGQGQPFSLSAAAQQALQDVTFLHDLYRGICVGATRMPTPTKPSAYQKTPAALRARLQRTGQLPDDLSTTTVLMEELTKLFARLERTNPDLCFRFVELLLEGFVNSPSDVADVADSVVLAEELMSISARATAAPGKASSPAPKDFPIDDATDPVVPEHRETVFNVAETLRVMPLMPARVISSDRAANTSAVLYNMWLRKQRKKHLWMDGN
ncbi:hypothetical protein JKF63_01287 [Porcisia hertigi]|uniref:Protein kinase domain-containing protein n=1 Tax=Porcisia hertigi TaxID=2761500 RepID=A0A836HUF3_9TRYP|nr:hypothetical protein JKF63_01287 [Porcisia hertigi]